MRADFNKILLVTAHPDDIEFGMGATLSSLVDDKSKKFRVIICSDCEDQPGNEGIIDELDDSMRFFGIKDYEVIGLPNTKLPSVGDSIREKLEIVKKRIPT